MSEDYVKGSVIPLNLTVRYSFSFSELQESIWYLGGDQNLLLEESEIPGTPIALPDDFKFIDNVEEFHHLEVFLTYLHEQFHLRHLTSSPIGFLLYVINARQYAYMYSAIRNWGERIGSSPEVPIRLPLNTHHVEDPDVQKIKVVWDVFGSYQTLFMESLSDTTLLEATSGILRPLTEELEQISASVLGTSDVYPDIDLGEAHNQSINPGGLTGRAVLEGLARMNEFMTLAYLNAPMELINSFVAEKQHGIYAQTSGVASALLNVSSVDSWMLVAKLSDWAMQAPVMPFLLRGRETISIMELLPAWRYFLLVSRFKQAGFKVSDLIENEREVATELFSSLGWDDPWRVAERILQEKLPTPNSALTRHYIENLQVGAQLRLSNSSFMSFPQMEDEVHRLGAVFNIFANEIYGGTTGKLAEDKDSWSLIASLVNDAIVDALLLDEDLTRPIHYAQLVSDFFGEKPTSGELLGRGLIDTLGQAGAKRIIEATGSGATGSQK